MDEKIENNNKKKSQKTRIIALVIFALFLIGAGGIILIKSKQQKNISDSNSSVEENLQSESEKVKEPENTEAGEGADGNSEEISGDVVTDKKTMVSENYRVSQVQLGVGGVSIEKGVSRNTKIEIFQVKSETIISQEDNEPRILITWKTNKEAISNVEYAKSDGKNAVVITEDGYGFEHSMLIKNMEFSTIYTYRIESMDKWGNKVNTEYFSAYTGDKTESIFDLITNAVEDVFGWAM